MNKAEPADPKKPPPWYEQLEAYAHAVMDEIAQRTGVQLDGVSSGAGGRLTMRLKGATVSSAMLGGKMAEFTVKGLTDDNREHVLRLCRFLLSEDE